MDALFLLLPEEHWPDDISNKKPNPDADDGAEIVLSAETTSLLNPQFIDLSKYPSFT